MARILINDGFTRDGLFNEPTTGLPPVHWRFRPALPDRAAEYMKATETLLARGKPGTGTLVVETMTQLLTEHLVSWDVEQEQEGGSWSVAPISAEAMRKMPYVVLSAMCDCVLSYRSSEPSGTTGD